MVMNTPVRMLRAIVILPSCLDLTVVHRLLRQTSICRDYGRNELCDRRLCRANRLGKGYRQLAKSFIFRSDNSVYGPGNAHVPPSGARAAYASEESKEHQNCLHDGEMLLRFGG